MYFFDNVVLLYQIKTINLVVKRGHSVNKSLKNNIGLINKEIIC